MQRVVHATLVVITKTNPNVGLDPEALSLATPRRDNIAALVDYLKNPVTYDGLESIAEVHPSIKSADIYPRMRSITDEDLYLNCWSHYVTTKNCNRKMGWW